MFVHPYVISAVAGTSFMMYFFMPLAGIIIAIAYLMLLMVMVNASGISIFMSPLAKSEIINLFITKAGKIVPEIVREDEGYARRKGWGIFKIVSGTKLIICGKPAILTTEGVPYSLLASDAQIAMLLAKSGIKTKKDLEKFLSVKIMTKQEVHDAATAEKEPRPLEREEAPQIPEA
jgi:hypothetical protein